MKTHIKYFKACGITVQVNSDFPIAENTFHSKFPFQANFMADFENASILYSTHEPDHIQVSNNDQIVLIQTENSDGYYNEIEYFANCLQTKSQPELCMPQSALQSIKLCYDHL